MSHLENEIKKSIYKANFEYLKHYFYYKEPKVNQKINVTSFDDQFYLSIPIQINNRYDLLSDPLTCLENNKKNEGVLNGVHLTDTNFKKLIKIKSLQCRHLLHDDEWLKFTNKNREELNVIFDEIFDTTKLKDSDSLYINSINSDDISDMNFLKFVDELKSINVEIMYVDYSEDNSNIKWIVIIK
jgi:hypothetical protein